MPKPKDTIVPKRYIPKTKRISKQAFVKRALEQFYIDHSYDTVYDGGSKLYEMASRRVLSATREYERLYKIDSFHIPNPVRTPIPSNIPIHIPFPYNIPFPDIFSPSLPKPYEIPSYQFHFLLDPVTRSFRPVIAHKALHVLKPAPRGFKEGKNRSKALSSYRMFSKFNQLFFGKYQEFDEIVKRFYDALPAKLIRFKGRDGKWHRKTINPLEMIDVVVSNFDQVDLVSVAGNWFKDEITDRYIGFWGNVSRNAAILFK